MLIPTDEYSDFEQLTTSCRKSELIAFCPFTIICDTREQAPYGFQNIKADAPDSNRTLVIPTKRIALKTGDYSILGYESEITIERKDHSDLYSTLIDGRERFTREFERMTAGNFRFAAVVVEASWSRIMQPPPGRKIHPKSISRSIMSFMLRYPTVQWITAPDRRFAECVTYQLLAKFWDHQQAEAKARKQKAVLPAATTRKAVGV